MGLAWTGMQHAEIPSGLGSVIFGWTTAFSAVTTSGATLTVTPNFDFSTLKFRYIATQGDKLQVFVLSFTTTTQTRAAEILAFNYPNQVSFDTSNPP